MSWLIGAAVVVVVLLAVVGEQKRRFDARIDEWHHELSKPDDEAELLAWLDEQERGIV